MMIEYISNNWDTILSLIVALHAVALIVVNMTPTPKDNEWLEKIYKWVELVAGVVSKKAKQ